MAISQFIQDMALKELSPTSIDYFEGRASALFVDPSQATLIDIYCSNSIQFCNDPRLRELSAEKSDWCYLPPSEKEAIDPETRERVLVDDAQRILRMRISDPEDLTWFIRGSAKSIRMFFISQKNSYSKLNVSRNLFEQILSQCAVFEGFKDFVLCFGAKARDNDVGPPRMRSSWSTLDPRDNDSVAFECAYVLRFVERNWKGTWSVRQTAFYHKSDSNHVAATWIFLHLSQTFRTRLCAYIDSCGPHSDFSPFELHLLFIDTAAATWRPYVADLIRDINDQTDRVVAASIDDNKTVVSEFGERQRLKQLEDSVLNLLIILESTIDTIEGLSDGYCKTLVARLGTPSSSSTAGELDIILRTLTERRKDMLLLKAKAEKIHCTVQGTANLFTSFLDQGNNHALRVMAVETKIENEAMRQLAERSTRDAAAVKVLSVVALVYLPVTVVSVCFTLIQSVFQATDLLSELLLDIVCYYHDIERWRLSHKRWKGLVDPDCSFDTTHGSNSCHMAHVGALANTWQPKTVSVDGRSAPGMFFDTAESSTGRYITAHSFPEGTRPGHVFKRFERPWSKFCTSVSEAEDALLKVVRRDSLSEGFSREFIRHWVGGQREPEHTFGICYMIRGNDEVTQAMVASRRRGKSKPAVRQKRNVAFFG